MSVDLATRAWDHSFRIDPIVRTLLDTDFYKFLMLQMIWKLKPDARVAFGLTNRTSAVRLADVIDEGELVAQLDHARTLRFARNELVWLAGNTFYGREHIFEPAFIAFLADFRLPPYELSRRDGQFELRFEGPWTHTTMWEVPCLAIVSELRARAAMAGMSRFELDLLYARAKAKLWAKIERLRALAGEGPLRVGDFGTRRRHSFLWQRWCVAALMEGLGGNFTGTSNVKHALDLGVDAIGTNAHELPMVYAAQAAAGQAQAAAGRAQVAAGQAQAAAGPQGAAASETDDAALRRAPYTVLEAWSKLYGGNLLVLLPDTFGTTNFLAGAPDWVADWTGARPDSKPPIEATEELIAWWRARGRDPREKLVILSDGMTIDSIEASVRALRGRVKLSIGWGTALTNDFGDCLPRDRSPGASAVDFKPVSLVCKVFEVDGRPAVKLSDNPAKVMGPPAEVERYARVLGYRAGRWRDA